MVTKTESHSPPLVVPLTTVGASSTDVLLILLMFLGVIHWMRIKSRKPGLKYPPGPWPLPIIGNLPQLGPSPHLSLSRMADVYGPIFQIKMGSWNAVILNSIDLVKEAFSSQRNDFAARPHFDSFQEIRGGRLLTFGRYDDGWKVQRKMITSSLTSFLKAHKGSSIQRCVLNQSECMIEELTKGVPIDPKRSLQLASSSIIYGVCFGLEKNFRQDAGFLKYLRVSDDFNDFQAAGGNTSDMMPWTKIFFQKKLEIFSGIVKAMARLVDSQRNAIKQTLGHQDAHSSVMATILEKVEVMDPEELRRLDLSEELLGGLCDDLMGAGMNTVVTAMRWALLYLVLNPEAKARVLAEINDVMGQDEPAEHHRKKMPYTEAFLMETLRVSAPVPFLLPHSALNDTTLAGYKVDKDTLIMVNTYAISRDPTIWSSPHSFKPERFLNEERTALNQTKLADFVPFGSGKRRCVGEQLAKLELFLLFTNLLKECDVRAPKGVELSTDAEFSLSLDPHPYKLIFTRKFKVEE